MLTTQYQITLLIITAVRTSNLIRNVTDQELFTMVILSRCLLPPHHLLLTGLKLLMERCKQYVPIPVACGNYVNIPTIYYSTLLGLYPLSDKDKKLLIFWRQVLSPSYAKNYRRDESAMVIPAG
jgi:hypothetical protein